MFKSKYSTILTILLAILIITIVIIVIVLGIKTYKDYRNEKDAKAFEQAQIDDYNNKPNKKEDKEDDDDERGSMKNMVVDNTNENNTGNNNNQVQSNLPKVRFYKNYPTVGNISIPKTKVSYPILLDTSAQALEIAVGVTYPSSPEINQPGNVVIIGHNYRNGKLFSNNKKLVVGDTIQIKGLDNKTLNYTIYEIFETTPTDTAYMTRNTDGRIEISLSTCTDDGNNRLVILARVEE